MIHEELKTCMGKKPFPYMRLKWVFIAVSLFFVIMSIREIAVKGLNFGVDFIGGVKVLYEFSVPTPIQKIREVTEKLEIGDVEVIQFGDENNSSQYMVRTKNIEGKDLFLILNQAITGAFGADKVKILSQEVVGAKVGQDLQKKALISIILTCALILIYIGFRFDFLFAPGAVIALIHDVLIATGFFAFFGKEFNLPILAALLTILGYSINDTIVIYDRIRENIARLPKKTPTVTVIDISLTETLRRTIVTSLTVWFVLFAMFYMGGGVLHDFTFCLLVGTIFGCYSTIFIASPIYLWLQRLFPNKGLKVTLPEEAKSAA